MLRRFTASSSFASKTACKITPTATTAASFSMMNSKTTFVVSSSSLSSLPILSVSRRFAAAAASTLSEFDDFILNSPESFAVEKQATVKQLQEKRAELQKMQLQYDDAMSASRSKVKLMGLAMACFLTAQWAVLFNWVFFMFDWNLVEPVTYFIGTSCAWFAAFWYSMTGHEWTYKGWNENTAAKMARKRLEKAEPGFMDKFEELTKEVERLHECENAVYLALESKKGDGI